jgi:hypothetical protein
MVWTAGWFLSDRSVLPSKTEYIAVEQDTNALDGPDAEESSEGQERRGQNRERTHEI